MHSAPPYPPPPQWRNLDDYFYEKVLLYCAHYQIIQMSQIATSSLNHFYRLRSTSSVESFVNLSDSHQHFQDSQRIMFQKQERQR